MPSVTVSFEVGASLGVPGLTAHRCVSVLGPLHGKRLLVYGAAGAIGHLVVQLASSRGAHVVGVVSSPAKIIVAMELGAADALDYTDPTCDEELALLASLGGFDAIVDIDFAAHGGAYTGLLSRCGQVVVVGSASNMRPSVDVLSLQKHGVTLHFVAGAEQPHALRAMAIEEVSARLAAGLLHSRVEVAFPLTDIVTAHERVEAGSLAGKVVVRLANAARFRTNTLSRGARARRDGLAAGYALALLSAVLFSTKSVIVKLAYAAGSDPEALLAVRMAIALPIYIAIWLHQQHGIPSISARAAARAAGIGVFGYGLSSYLDLKGLEYISASLERLILFTYPFFVAVFGTLIFGITIQRAAAAGLFVSYAGLAIVVLDNVGPSWRLDLLGTVLVTGSAATFALFQLLAGQAVRAVGAVHFTCISMVGAALACNVAFVAHRPWTALLPSAHVGVLALVLAVFGTVLPSFALGAALKRISAQANSTIGAVSPVITTLLCVWLLGDVLTLRGALGGVMVIAGAVWFTFREPPSVDTPVFDRNSAASPAKDALQGPSR
jgi:drug/metabolite transporter (DMT)-like permease